MRILLITIYNWKIEYFHPSVIKSNLLCWSRPNFVWMMVQYMYLTFSSHVQMFHSINKIIMWSKLLPALLSPPWSWWFLVCGPAFHRGRSGRREIVVQTWAVHLSPSRGWWTGRPTSYQTAGPTTEQGINDAKLYSQTRVLRTGYAVSVQSSELKYKSTFWQVPPTHLRIGDAIYVRCSGLNHKPNIWQVFNTHHC